ncbi:hypothetical protein HK096_006645 [Nowakowskiella sp. JEL0078]|nr:hypothetical protein HK096_006645 [Nowakowskiella sp. JEL0078]
MKKIGSKRFKKVHLNPPQATSSDFSLSSRPRASAPIDLSLLNPGKSALLEIAYKNGDPLALLYIGRKACLKFKKMLRSSDVDIDEIYGALDSFRQCARQRYAEGCRHLAFILWQLAYSPKYIWSSMSCVSLTERNEWKEEAFENLRLAVEYAGGPSIDFLDITISDDNQQSTSYISDECSELSCYDSISSSILSKLILRLGKWHLIVSNEMRAQSQSQESILICNASSRQHYIAAIQYFILSSKSGCKEALQTLVYQLSQCLPSLPPTLAHIAVQTLERSNDTTSLKFLTSYYQHLVQTASTKDLNSQKQAHEKCLYLLEKLSNEGDTPSTLVLASTYQDPPLHISLTQHNPCRALGLYLNAAECGEVRGVVGATGLLLFGDMTPQDPTSRVPQNIPRAVGVVAKSVSQGLPADFKQLGDVLISLCFGNQDLAFKCFGTRDLALWCYATAAFGCAWSLVAEEVFRDCQIKEVESRKIVEGNMKNTLEVLVCEVDRQLTVLYSILYSLFENPHVHNVEAENVVLENCNLNGKIEHQKQQIEASLLLSEHIQDCFIKTSTESTLSFGSKNHILKKLEHGLMLHSGILGNTQALKNFTRKCWFGITCDGCKRIAIEVAIKLIHTLHNDSQTDIDEFETRNKLLNDPAMMNNIIEN